MTQTQSQSACTRCIMTMVDDPQTTFNEEGLCNHCQSFDVAFARVPKTTEESAVLLAPIIAEMKAAGQGKPYDCLLGISGGVDSTYIALLLKRLGLRPLCVHFDNGWNTELAVQNIDRVVTTLDYDLETYVIDWDDFRELQLAYLRAGVIDIEALSDHAIYGALYELAIRNGIGHIISGVNVATEQFLPGHWIYDKMDDANIRDIYRKHGGGRPLRNYPFLDARQRRRIRSAGIKIVEILNVIPFDVQEARADIIRELGWVPYDGKHHESIFTRFYQGYILPRKFGVDKRKAHLSNLVCSGMLTREEALFEFQQDIYPPDQARDDLEFVCKKLRLSVEEFEVLMKEPPRRHLDFENYRWFFSRYPLAKPLLPLWRRYKAWKSA
ncbi:N-acetyl sugar amidotransferase [Sulfitobacter sp. JL08]|uniref:N-acetyl sugar amidotransferase n=1 Tax=Sulfitobacter sp. JL08 TaxID=2070369 RepID=UPI000E0BD7D3|nr:N-acetyl sugar amidotransferase [Sulfitobacter sp. JL08]AXI54114.1 N-acetyl sugar amidotransferase [Sulfitobacter sp. JL08]